MRDMQLHAAQQGPVLVHHEDSVFPALLLRMGEERPRAVHQRARDARTAAGRVRVRPEEERAVTTWFDVAAWPEGVPERAYPRAVECASTYEVGRALRQQPRPWPAPTRRS